MIKIAYLVSSVKNLGPINVMIDIIKKINSEFDITIISIFNDDDKILVESLIKDYNIKHINLKYTKKGILKNNVIKKVNTYLKDYNINVVHSHGFITDIILSKLDKDILKISTIHNNIWNDYKYKFGFIKSKIISLIHINALNKIDYPITCSSSSYDMLKKNIRNLTYIRNKIDITNYSFNEDDRVLVRKKLNIGKNDNVFIYVGALTNRKNVLNLATKFKNSRDLNDYLLILGNGPLMKKIENLNDSNIKLLGFIDKLEISKYLSTSDYYVSASLAEGFSLSVLEALSHNNYLLLSDIDAHNEIFSLDTTYIGETFNENNFLEQFNKIKKEKKDIEQLNKFKQNYIDSEIMANEYKKYYRGGDNI